MEEFVLFIITYVFIFILYEVFIVLRAKKNVRKKKDNKQPMEIKYLITKYKLDLKRVNYNKLLHVTALVSSLDMTVILTIALIFDNYLLQLLVIVVLVIPVILVSYHIVYLIYKKKGLI